MAFVTVRGFEIHQGLLPPDEQLGVVHDLRKCLSQAPLFQPVTPRGRPMSVRMSAAGPFGWVSDRRGYRYEPLHPSGVTWPPIPERLLSLWHSLVPDARAPECCLINWYAEGQ